MTFASPWSENASKHHACIDFGSTQKQSDRVDWHMQAAQEHPSISSSSSHIQSRCQAGIARCTIQTGDVRNGVKAALALGRHDVLMDCAAMLQANSSSLLEAAELYEACSQHEKACAIYIKAKAFAKAEPLMKGVKSTKLLLAVSLLLCGRCHALLFALVVDCLGKCLPMQSKLQ
jgi:hypothetical protein